MASRALVLVVQDLPSLRDSIGDALREAGCEPLLAGDFASAIRILDRSTPDLVCLDLALPRESGLELVDHIRRAPGALRDVPIVVMSDRSSPEDMADAEDAGANAFLKKPVPIDRLLADMLTLLEQQSPSSHSNFRTLQPLDARDRQSTTHGRSIVVQQAPPRVPNPVVATEPAAGSLTVTAWPPAPARRLPTTSLFVADEVDNADDLELEMEVEDDAPTQRWSPSQTR
jgi:CheY-like chemotaxis protein